MRAARRSLPRGIALLLTAALTGVLVLLGSGVASAHAYLRGSTPAQGSTVQGLPSTVVLEFNETIHNFQPVVVVTGPDGKNYATGAPSVVGNAVSSTVSTDGPAGAYSMAYRVVSADGHPVEGEVKFTVAAPASSAAAPSSSSAGSRPSSTAPSTAAAGSTTPSTGSAAGSAVSGTAEFGTAESTSAGSSTAVSTSAESSTAVSTSSSSGPAPSPGAPSSGAGVGASTPVEAAGSPAAQTSSGPDWWIWAAIAVAAVVLAVAGVITLRRPHED